MYFPDNRIHREILNYALHVCQVLYVLDVPYVYRALDVLNVLYVLFVLCALCTQKKKLLVSL